jgi:hypothetical protein
VLLKGLIVGIDYIVGRVTDLPVASCDEIAKAINRLKTEKLRSISPAEVESIFTRMSESLAEASATAATLDKAVTDESIGFALQALQGTSDLIFALAVFSGNSKLLATSGAVKIITDTSVFAWQIGSVTTGAATSYQIVGQYAVDRAVFLIAGGLNGAADTVPEKILNLGTAISAVGFRLTEAAIDWQATKLAATKASNHLRSIEQSYSNVLVNSAATRKYRMDILDRQTAYLNLVKGFYPQSNCRNENIPLIPPILG